VALAWCTRWVGTWLPFPGTKRRRYLEDNIGALDVILDDGDLAGLNALGGATGDRHADMSPLNG
jgi:aryl-alcohol dehydrogenase-like predicted oxidoreductase